MNGTVLKSPLTRGKVLLMSILVMLILIALLMTVFLQRTHAGNDPIVMGSVVRANAVAVCVERGDMLVLVMNGVPATEGKRCFLFRDTYFIVLQRYEQLSKCLLIEVLIILPGTYDIVGNPMMLNAYACSESPVYTPEEWERMTSRFGGKNQSMSF